MRAQRSRNTGCEIALRKELHALGVRYRVHRRPLANMRREADIVFGPARIAVFVDGCFWHACPIHGSVPKANHEWWVKKLRRNRTRDKNTDKILREAGWLAVRIWEHENSRRAAERISRLVRRRIVRHLGALQSSSGRHD
jgi:DNA mismatch endonuclease (patch repair protein)